MTLAHLTLATQHVERTAAFLEDTLGYARRPVPKNSPVDAQWITLGRGQDIHIVRVEGYQASPFEGEFGRHIAVFHPKRDFPALRARLAERGAEVFDPERTTPFDRFFFREPVNGYVFEVIEERPVSEIY